MTAARTALRALAFAILLASGVARAEDAAPKREAAKPEAARSAAPAKMKVLHLDEFTVEGHIQKPQAFFILQRSNLSFDDGDKKETFLPKIVKTCEKDPF